MEIIKSQILPLPRKDVDTDLIIPAEFLTTTTKTGLGEHVFERLRQADPDFPFNKMEYIDSEILVTRDNFGCGSSREHAPWALYDWGIRVIVAPSFADIFFTNAMKNGILLIELGEAIIEEIFEAEQKGEYQIEVDLPQQKITLPGGAVHEFDIDPYRKECLIKGMDDLDYLLSNTDEIKEFEAEHANELFFDLTKL